MASSGAGIAAGGVSPPTSRAMTVVTHDTTSARVHSLTRLPNTHVQHDTQPPKRARARTHTHAHTGNFSCAEANFLPRVGIRRPQVHMKKTHLYVYINMHLSSLSLSPLSHPPGPSFSPSLHSLSVGFPLFISHVHAHTDETRARTHRYTISLERSLSLSSPSFLPSSRPRVHPSLPPSLPVILTQLVSVNVTAQSTRVQITIILLLLLSLFIIVF
jgi:hypothetical protein